MRVRRAGPGATESDGPTGAAGAAGPWPQDAASQGGLYAVIGALMLGMLLAALDQTIVATALPTIVSDLRGGGLRDVRGADLPAAVPAGAPGRLADDVHLGHDAAGGTR
jgi:hypothetical protein